MNEKLAIIKDVQYSENGSDVCPHCLKEIHEHDYIFDNGIWYHSECGKPVAFPGSNNEEI